MRTDPDRSITRRALVALAACAGLLGRRPARAAAPQPGPIEDVSLIQLIADPDRYDGRLVRLKGFLRVEFEGTAVYLSRDDASYLITGNGLWVDFRHDGPGGDGKVPGPKNLHRQFALIEATFDKANRGHMGLWSGALRDVRRAQAARRYDD